MVQNLLVNAGDITGIGLIPQLGRSPGGRNGNVLQYFCLENPMDRGAWRVIYSPGSHKSQTGLKRQSTHTTFKEGILRGHS